MINFIKKYYKYILIALVSGIITLLILLSIPFKQKIPYYYVNKTYEDFTLTKNIWRTKYSGYIETDSGRLYKTLTLKFGKVSEYCEMYAGSSVAKIYWNSKDTRQEFSYTREYNSSKYCLEGSEGKYVLIYPDGEIEAVTAEGTFTGYYTEKNLCEREISGTNTEVNCYDFNKYTFYPVWKIRTGKETTFVKMKITSEPNGEILESADGEWVIFQGVKYIKCSNAE